MDLLAKKYKEGWIDCEIGEIASVCNVLLETFKPKLELSDPLDFHYPEPAGNSKLVSLLEEKHKAPVIITSGAKQALAAIFYSLAKTGHKTLGYRTPFWALIPPLANMCGLQCNDNYDSYLLISPNNPDGFTLTYEQIKQFCEEHREKKIPVIHDGVYHTHTYLPFDYKLDPLADVQIFSCSKMLGLSGLRVGYMVFNDTRFYKDVLGYVEATTVGVSTVSQKIVAEVFNPTNSHLYDVFVQKTNKLILEAKRIVKDINPEILEIPNDMETIPGAFGWFKKGPKFQDATEKAKILMADGKLFGDKDKVRMNLGLPLDTLSAVVKRLNSSI